MACIKGSIYNRRLSCTYECTSRLHGLDAGTVCVCVYWAYFGYGCDPQNRRKCEKKNSKVAKDVFNLSNKITVTSTIFNVNVKWPLAHYFNIISIQWTSTLCNSPIDNNMNSEYVCIGCTFPSMHKPEPMSRWWWRCHNAMALINGKKSKTKSDVIRSDGVIYSVNIFFPVILNKMKWEMTPNPRQPWRIANDPCQLCYFFFSSKWFNVNENFYHWQINKYYKGQDRILESWWNWIVLFTENISADFYISCEWNEKEIHSNEKFSIARSYA